MAEGILNRVFGWGKFEVPSTTVGILKRSKQVEGFMSKVSVGEAVTAGQLLYFDATAGQYMKADADAAGKKPAMCLALEDGAADNAIVTVLFWGYVYNAADNWTAGAPIYLSATPGALTQSAPGSGNDQIVGYSVSADEMLFMPIAKMF